MSGGNMSYTLQRQLRASKPSLASVTKSLSRCITLKGPALYKSKSRRFGTGFVIVPGFIAPCTMIEYTKSMQLEWNAEN